MESEETTQPHTKFDTVLSTKVLRVRMSLARFRWRGIGNK